MGPRHDNLYLASLLESQDDENYVLVGQIDGDFVGILAISSVVDDIQQMAQSFDISVFDNFSRRPLQPEQRGVCSSLSFILPSLTVVFQRTSNLWHLTTCSVLFSFV